MFDLKYVRQVNVSRVLIGYLNIFVTKECKDAFTIHFSSSSVKYFIRE